MTWSSSLRMLETLEAGLIPLQIYVIFVMKKEVGGELHIRYHRYVLALTSIWCHSVSFVPTQVPSQVTQPTATPLYNNSSDDSLPNSWEDMVRSLKPVVIPTSTIKLPSKKAIDNKKQKAADLLPPNTHDKKTKGRKVGAKKWCEEETTRLLDTVEAVLPVGPKGWGEITKRFNSMANRDDMPERAQKSLELRFKKVCIIFLFTYTQCLQGDQVGPHS